VVIKISRGDGVEFSAGVGVWEITTRNYRRDGWKKRLLWPMSCRDIPERQPHAASDEFGFNAIENKVHVHDFQATVLHLLGIDHERLAYKFQGRHYRLTDVHGNVVREVLA